MTREQGHRWFAAFYERMMGGAEKSFMRDVRLDVAGGARGRVLEIGCGPGFNFRYYGDGVTELIATDPDPFMDMLNTQGLPWQVKELPGPLEF